MPLLKTDAPALENIDSWINSAPINLEDGTHLLYFWNYSCKCCRDRLELFQRIHEEYSELEVIGIHTAQFGFERDERNLEKAIERLDIGHAVAHDAHENISEQYNLAYSNQALVVDEGSIVYQQTSKMETKELVDQISDILGIEKEVKTSDLDQDVSTQEFFGYSRTSGLNQEGNHPGKKDYRLPENRIKGEAYLKGLWEQTEHYIESKGNSELRFNFESSEVNLVVDPNDALRDIEVLVNGESVSEGDAGEDLRIENGRSYIRLKHPGLYNLFDSEHQESEIALIPDNKTRFYALSFGQPEI